MASTCKYCGRDTWGRYQLCPDCRKERKRKGSRFGTGGFNYSGSGAKYVCNSCGYHWVSKKSFGSPSICPNCKEDNIVDYYTTEEYRIERKERQKTEAIKILIFFAIIIGFFWFMHSLTNTSNSQGTISPADIIKQAEQECLSSGGFYYQQSCTPLESIKNHKNLCNSDGLKPIIFITGSSGNWDCYKGKINSDKLSESQKTEVLNCENLGNVPLVTDKVNCIELTSSPSSSTPEEVSPEEKLITSCISKYSGAGIFDLKKTDYLEDFSSASDWIRNNYENSALTQEQKDHNINYIINNQLPKENYPIVITWASKKDGQMTATGFFYCNQNGVIN